MRVMVERYLNFQRPNTPLTFEVYPGEQLLPRDVAAYVIASGAGRAVDIHPGDKRGGLAALIARKRRPAT